MKKKLLTLMLLAGGSMFAATHFSIGVGVGVPGYYGQYAPGYYPAPPPQVVALRPPCPGPGYSWVDGYWAPGGAWVGGYWRQPYGGSYWAGPRYHEREREWDHDRHWDREHHRDRDRDWDRGRRR